ncbi:ectoine/hydroxyectoine ABC transporter, permease protein EhuD [Denitrovibrio acetiphilus DSM 12809]|uniref:Ectoine/hydroxyectoine ABC transporter, permease protein EhuD n=1 Tax=Denitrovibrio acetiphilus (strain DSM 12809 / NBRC 114555 / N2460) TaxID=522772 RepID=D4H1W9_DENA2|nr:ectoine/hydroxyectoine ABC transporter permease subunit EhuD [Denitrovibrio acetiphilus]ADD66946.1 ectoine/hydroxyectoine ABC transporter, permease protein EhuD [Denitrovibrio acetiphilus DSM 12809]
MSFDWKWGFVWDILPRLIEATGNTVMAACFGYLIAIVLGLMFALGQRTRFKVLSVVLRETVEFIRSTPLVLQIFFVFYVGPQVGVMLSPWTAGMIAIGLHYGAYLSEVYRAGIESVPKGQWEAAVSLSLSRVRTYTRVILPQAVPPAFAGMGNYLVGIFKDTPMLSVIGVAELMHTANSIGSENYRYLEPYTLVGVIFLLISLPTAWMLRILERVIRKKMGLRLR